MVQHSGARGADRSGADRAGLLGTVARAHRLHAPRRPGLSHCQRAASRRRVPGAHAAGHGESDRRCEASPRRRSGRRNQRRSRCSTTAPRFRTPASPTSFLKDWDERDKAKGQDLIALFKTLRAALQDEIMDASTTVIPPPPIQGIGNSGGFTMEVEMRDGSVRFRQAAERRDRDRERRQIPVGGADRVFALPRVRAAAPSRHRQEQGRNAWRHRRAGLRGAWKLHRFDLCRAVQQVRPGFPGLRPVGFAIPG